MNTVLYAFDIAVNERVLIEYNGEHWHKDSGVKDAEKRQVGENAGFVVLTIGERDWLSDKTGAKSLLLSSLAFLLSGSMVSG